MSTATNEPARGFAIWITGLPSSGKSTLARALDRQLRLRGIAPAVLESDVLRSVLTPKPTYTEEERAIVYGAIVYIAKLLTEHGVTVIIDATANRRIYREQARHEIPRFFEVFIDCPLQVCMQRDSKGIYRRGREQAAGTVPGLQAPYEPPLSPEIVVRNESPDLAANRIVDALVSRGLMPNLPPPVQPDDEVRLAAWEGEGGASSSVETPNQDPVECHS